MEPRSLHESAMSTAGNGAPGKRDRPPRPAGMVSAEWPVGSSPPSASRGADRGGHDRAVQDALLAFILKLINSFGGLMIGR